MPQVRKLSVPALALALLVLAASAVGWVTWRASRALRQAQSDVASENTFRFSTRPLVGSPVPSFEPVSSPEVFLQLAAFRGHLFLAGPNGLQEFDSAGAPLREFVAGRELPGSPLVALATGRVTGAADTELILATSSDGILFYDGNAFRQLLPSDAEARSITAILPVSSGHLLIGTRKRGVLVFDGKQLTPLHPTLSNLYVQALAGSDTDLWVGTLDRGALHWHAGTTDVFSEPQGLPDRQVQAIALAGDRAYVGTVLGVAEFDQGRFSRVLAPGALVTSLLVQGDQLLVGSQDQGLLQIPLAAQRLRPAHHPGVEFKEVRQLVANGDSVWALTRNALYQRDSSGPGWREVLQPRPAQLSDRNISALAFDARGQLWVGYFDRGLDILPGDARPATHVENERIFCINRILPDASSGTVAVATANGLVKFDAAGSLQQVLTRADGLIADHVTDIAPYEGGLAVATPAGLTFLDAGGARSIFSFHGLANSHVYALGVSGDDLLVGTLGGLSTLVRGDVRVSYSAGSSGLKHNWITAVVPVGDGWMVGTYGGGVVGFDREGHFQSFDKASGAMEVNPNAMLVTPGHVFAGMLGDGLYVYDRQRGVWTAHVEGLPSRNVTALAARGGYLYVGTDNGLVRIPEQKFEP